MSNQMLELWSGWSSSRNDTRTQVGDQFESMYDGYKAPIGFIWSEQEEGMVPLYNRWSGSRNDTRTQVGDQFESMYDGGMNRLGFIYKQDKGDMVPLYNRWSGSRNDTRSQVGNQFEPMYNGGMNLLGYIRPVGKIVLKSMNFPSLQSELLGNIETQDFYSDEFENKGDTEQTHLFKKTWEVVESYEFAWENATTVGMTVEGEGYILPGALGFGAKASVQNTFTIGESKRNEKTSTLVVNYPVVAPARKKVNLRATLFRKNINLHFEATLAIINIDGTLGREWKEYGIYKGVETVRSDVEVSEEQLIN